MTAGFYLHRYEIPRKERLSDKEIKQLIKEYQATNSEEKKEEIIKNSLYMIKTVIKTSHKNKENYEDDYQAGVIGMLLAIENFDTERGVQWNTFATKCIRRTIIREFQKRERSKKNGYDVHGLEHKEKSLENIIQDEQNIEEEIIEREFAKEVAKNAKNILTQTEFEVLEQVYGINGKDKKTYKQIAEQLGKSQSTIRTQTAEGIKKLRKEYMEG